MDDLRNGRPLRIHKSSPSPPQPFPHRHDVQEMAGLFDEQARAYAEGRPDYPPWLFSFLASLTPRHHRAWDVGTGNGQAALALAEHYQEVIATDVSEKQLAYAPQRHNITYACTAPRMLDEELHHVIGENNSIDLITVAQALHWFDLEHFYGQAKQVLRKPGGIIAAWCYTVPRVNSTIDSVFDQFYEASGPFWEPARLAVDEEYRNLSFPFEPVPTEVNELGTGPVHFKAQKKMDIEAFLTYLGSMSVLQCARCKGVELLDQHRKDAFRKAWGGADKTLVVTFPVHLRIGTVP